MYFSIQEVFIGYLHIKKNGFRVELLITENDREMSTGQAS